MGQGHPKASKRREANGEQSPSPKKEAKKSPKRSSRSPSQELSKSSHGAIQIEEREASPVRRKGSRGSKGRQSASPEKEVQNSNGVQNEAHNMESEMDALEIAVTPTILSKSPPKPKRTYEVEFVEPEKENVPISEEIINVSEISKIQSSPKTPSKMNGMDSEPLTPVRINELNRPPQATSTPAAPNGILTTGRQLSGGPYSDDDHTDVSDDEAYSSEQPYHTPSPTASNVSLKSFSTINSSSVRTKSCLMHTLAGMCLPASRLWHSANQVEDSSYERKSEAPNFGKFYNMSYLKSGSQNYLDRKPKAQPEPRNNINQFMRPANFSYSKQPPDFLKNKKGGMMTLAQGKTVVKTTRRSSSPAGIRNTEAYKLSMWPGGKPPQPKEIAKIDRDDWPAPPSPAAILPEILRQRRKSRGEEDDDEDETGVYEDPKIKREIEELEKFKDKSGIGTVIYKELEEAKLLPLKALDPWKASRVPNAAYEPKYQTRYQSPMFASPSRFLDRTRRSWDDSDIRGYRTMTTMANFPVPKPGYGLAPRAATLPLSGLYGGPLDYRYYDDLELPESSHDTTRVSMSSINTEASKVTSTVFDQPGVSLMTFQKSSWHTNSKPPEYPYDRLMISNFDLPKDVDRNMLEIHLSKDEFESIFDMGQEEFKHLPEWKQNDLKKKKDLY